MVGLIKKIFYDNYGVYGAKRIYEILKLNGYSISYKTVYYHCSNNGLMSIRHKIKSLKIPKPIKEYEKVRTGRSRTSNVMRLFPRTINEVWVTDWTRFFVEEKIVYLYVIMDLFSRRIIGYGINFVGESADTQIKVLKDTIINRSPSDNLTIHSDNDSAFKDKFYKEIVERMGIHQSFNFVMSNNNFMESFFASFWTEFYFPSFLNDNYFIHNLTLDNLDLQLKRYINFYNNKRAHSSLGYVTPRQYESTISTYVPIKYRRQILHVDINACFAQYECMLKPSLKGKNLVVIGEEYKRDQVIVCASYEARKYGIGCGDSLRYAKFKCKDLIVRKSAKKKYTEISQRFFEILYHYSDRVEPYGIDEAWVDVTHSTMLFGSPLHIAELIMNEIKVEMGITVSIGLSFNKIYSKLASDIHKPNAITYIPYKYHKKIVFSRPVEELLFVGERTTEMFHFYGIHTIGDLAFAKFEDVRDIVGEKWARKLIDYANGFEFSEVKLYGEKTPIKSISKSETFYKNAKCYDDIRKMVVMLSEDVAKRLREEKKMAYAICVKLRDTHYNDHSMQCQVSVGLDNGILISEVVEKLVFKNMLNKIITNYVEDLPSMADYQRPFKFEIRQMAVIGFKLGSVESNLLNEKIRKVDVAVDKINKKYNSNIVRSGVLCEPWYYRFI